MKVFISWSGDTSRAIAEVLKAWLPSVIQAIKPYFSPDDITKGSRWSTEIAKELEECQLGLICLTADNLEAPWIMFEAGAVSKSLSAARVCPLLFGIDSSDVKGPLVQFQAAPFTKEEMKKAIRMMNQQLGPTALEPEVIDSVYEMWWPALEEKIKAILATGPRKPKGAVRTERDILEEILARVRVVPAAPQREAIHPSAVRDLVSSYDRLMFEIGQLPPETREALLEIIDRLGTPIDYIARRTIGDDSPTFLSRRQRLDTMHNRPLLSEEPRDREIEEIDPRLKQTKRGKPMTS